MPHKHFVPSHKIAKKSLTTVREFSHKIAPCFLYLMRTCCLHGFPHLLIPPYTRCSATVFPHLYCTFCPSAIFRISHFTSGHPQLGGARYTLEYTEVIFWLVPWSTGPVLVSYIRNLNTETNAGVFSCPELGRICYRISLATYIHSPDSPNVNLWQTFAHRVFIVCDKIIR